MKKDYLPAVEAQSAFPAELTNARALMRQALGLLDEFSVSAAAASLDMAIHQLDRELSASRLE